MTARGSRSEAADEKRERYNCKCCPSEYAEAIHIGQHVRLVAELPIHIRQRGTVRIAGGKATVHKKGSQSAHALLEEAGCLRKCRAHYRLMIVKAALACRGDESDAEAAAPVAEKVRK